MVFPIQGCQMTFLFLGLLFLLWVEGQSAVQTKVVVSVSKVFALEHQTLEREESSNVLFMVAPWMLQLLLIALTTSGVCGLTAATITTGGTKCSATPARRVESEATASTDAACGGGCGKD